jgi:hypothetical protein
VIVFPAEALLLLIVAPPVEVSLVQGQNVLNFSVQQGSRGVTIKDFALTVLR